MASYCKLDQIDYEYSIWIKFAAIFADKLRDPDAIIEDGDIYHSSESKIVRDYIYQAMAEHGKNVKMWIASKHHTMPNSETKPVLINNSFFSKDSFL